MKKLSALCLSLLLAVALGACGTSREATKSQTGAAPTAQAQKTPVPQTQPAAPGSSDQQKAVVAPTTAAKAPQVPVVLKDIYFDLDKYTVTSESGNILKQDSAWFKANPVGRLVIEGNCDERGTVEYNLALGQKRADAAKNYLMTLGVEGKKLDTISYGKEKPVDAGHTEEAWAKNRRDHFVPVK